MIVFFVGKVQMTVLLPKKQLCISLKREGERKMKVMKKKVMALVLVLALACVGLVGCGAIDINDIKGDWTLDTINDQSLSDFAASLGTDENLLFVNWTINEDKTVTTTNAVASGKLTMELKSNGFEASEEGSENKFSVEYNKDAGTLTYKIEEGGTVNTCVMKKGTYTPTETEAAEPEGEEESEEAAEEVEESEDEEEYLDDSEDEESSDEEYEDESTDEEYEEEAE